MDENYIDEVFLHEIMEEIGKILNETPPGEDGSKNVGPEILRKLEELRARFIIDILMRRELAEDALARARDDAEIKAIVGDAISRRHDRNVLGLYRHTFGEEKTRRILRIMQVGGFDRKYLRFIKGGKNDTDHEN